MKISICILAIFLSGCFWRTPDGPVITVPTKPSEQGESKPKPKPPKPPKLPKQSKPKPHEQPEDHASGVPVGESLKYSAMIEKILDKYQAATTDRIKYAQKLSKNIISLSSKKDENPELFSTTFGQSKKTLVELIASLPIVAESIEAIDFIKYKSTPEEFLFQLGGGDVNALINELLRPGRSDDSSTEMEKLFGVMVQAFRENNKEFPIEPAKAIAILDLVKDDKDNLAFAFDEVAQNQALQPQIFQWVGVNVEHPLVSRSFAKIYNSYSEDKKLLARSNVLLGMKNYFGDNKFSGIMQKHAADLGLTSLNTLEFDLKGILPHGTKATISQIDSERIKGFAPSLIKIELENRADKALSDVTEQGKLMKSLPLDATVRGLQNARGYSCYLNSITQTLLHTPEINQLLTYYINNNGLPFFKGRQMPLLSSLAELAKMYRNSSNENAVSPKDWTDLAIATSNIGCGQQDTSNFFTLLYGKLDEELNVVSSQPLNYLLKDHERADFDFVQKSFQGQIFALFDLWLRGYDSSQIIYKDKNRKTLVNYDPIGGLDLSFPNKAEIKGELKLDDFISEYLKSGPTDDAKIESKKISFIRLPKILRITLKRFEFDKSFNARKVNDPVTYPAVLEIEDSQGKKIFDLYSVVQHSGGVDGGHYWADIKAGDGQWHNVNDSHASKITEADALSRKTEAYMLFYRMRP